MCLGPVVAVLRKKKIRDLKGVAGADAQEKKPQQNVGVECAVGIHFVSFLCVLFPLKDFKFYVLNDWNIAGVITTIER